MTSMIMFGLNFYVLCLLLISLLVGEVLAQPCTLCIDGSSPDLGRATFDGTPCSELNAGALQISQNDVQECLLLQAFGHQSCGCPTSPPFPQDACRICPDDSDITEPQRELPGINTTCGELEIGVNFFLNDSEYCSILSQFDYYCGCPNVETSCNACPNGTKVSNPEVLVPFFNETCEVVELFGSLNPNETECEQYQALFMFANDNNICGCAEPPIPTLGPTMNPTATDSSQASSFRANKGLLNHTFVSLAVIYVLSCIIPVEVFLEALRPREWLYLL